MAVIGVEELAHIMGISVGSVYRRRCEKPETLPPAVKVGNRLRWRTDTIDKWMHEQEEKQ